MSRDVSAKRQRVKRDGDDAAQKNGPRAGHWDGIEDGLLRDGVENLGPRSWKQISADYFRGTRTPVQCHHRWAKVLQPGLRKGAWGKEEDAMIIECVSRGITKWIDVAEHMDGRSAKQCSERFSNQLNPNINRGPWTADEDRIISEAQERVGNKWTVIAALLVGRPENMVKNRWNSASWKKKRAADAKIV
jgi:hypothetical protein